jgi:uncharacterized membrane protein YgaE (UPF0421/DUF939 family)
VNTDSSTDPLLSQFLTQLRRFGMGERVLKTALAAGLAWYLATLIPNNDHPYLAPVTAVLAMQLTIAQSLDHALQRILGVFVGVFVAVAVFELFGVHFWSISLVVLVSFVGGLQLRLSGQAVQQVAVTALIVLLAGSISGTFEYAAFRIADSLIGAGVALALNWLFVPPVFVSPATGAIQRMAQDLAATLADVTSSLRSGMTQTAADDHLTHARSMASLLQEAHAALNQAELSLRYNRLARGQHATMTELSIRSTALEHSAIQLRVMCRSIQTAFQDDSANWMEPDQFGRKLADLFGRNTVLVRYVGGDRLGVRPVVPSTDELRREMQAYWRDRDDKGWLYAGEILTVAERMAKELDAAIDSGNPA